MIFWRLATGVVLIVLLALKHMRRQNELRAELYTKALEKGMELPANFFAPVAKKRNYLNIGIVCIAVGLGIALFFVMMALFSEKDAIGGAPVGVIPFLIGVAFVFIHYLGKKEK
ncbi:hypothetical protein FACS189456_7530 [Bacteroidia bacterium]|nr:hypothetical protein FACS189456_7530 [Bacteroidia bacterium]